MTTIACDGRSMAGDGRGCANDSIRTENEVKVLRLRDGRLAGYSGSASSGKTFIAWLNDGGEMPKLDKGFHVLTLAPNGTATVYYDDGTSDPADLPAVLGSGGNIALGAMLAGASAQKAVSMAAKRDPFTGGNITTLHLAEQLRSVA